MKNQTLQTVDNSRATFDNSKNLWSKKTVLFHYIRLLHKPNQIEGNSRSQSGPYKFCKYYEMREGFRKILDIPKKVLWISLGLNVTYKLSKLED